MRAELYLYGRYEPSGADILIHTLLGIFFWLPSAHEPDEVSLCMKVTLVVPPLLKEILLYFNKE